MKRRLWIPLTGAALVFLATGYDPSADSIAGQPAGTWQDVLAAYQQARGSEQPGDVDRALALADTYLAGHPQDGRALTYRGSLAALRARLSWLPWKKLGLLGEGIQQMDDGVTLVIKSDPGSGLEIEARMVRGITSANIPSTFGRGGVAFADFKAVVRHVHFAVMPASQRATALSWLAVMYQRQGQPVEADRMRREAETLDPAIARQIREQTQ